MRAALRYCIGMTDRPRPLPSVYCGQVLLLVAPHAFLNQALPAWIARLAFNGPLRILDGGGRFNPYSLGRPLRHLTPQVAEVMQGIHIQRSFTCYQMAALLDEISIHDDDATPLLALDLLTTFYDEDVAAHERRRLLTGVLERLNRLSQIVPVAVTAAPRSEEDEDPWLAALEVGLENPRTWWFDTTPTPPLPLTLF